MNKRGVALVFAFLVSMVLFILLGSFFLKSMNENNLVRRYINSTRAFWVSEAGVAAAIKNLPNNGTGNLGNYSYQWTTAYRTTISSSDYYDITSTGIVAFPSGGDIRRTVNVVVKRGSVDPSAFQYGIQAANDLCFGGASCNKNPNDFLDPDICDGHPCWKESDTTINFPNLFVGYTQSDVQAIATHYTDTTFPGAVSGVTWVDVAAGNTLMVTGSETGSGVLIINGNVHFGGTYQFYGVIYVLGTLTARGTFDAYGSMVVASTSDVDSINGTPEFHYNWTYVESALQNLSNSFSKIVSWRE